MNSTVTNHALLRDNTSRRDVNDLKSALLFNRFDSIGLCIAPSCEQHTERPGAFVRSAWARGSFQGRIYRHPEQRFKGNICNNLCSDILTRLFGDFLNYFSPHWHRNLFFHGQLRWTTLKQFLKTSTFSHATFRCAFTRFYLCFVSQHLTLNSFLHQEYLTVVFDIPGEWDRISNCLNAIQVRGMRSLFIENMFCYRSQLTK